MDALVTIDQFNTNKDYKKALIKHTEMVLNVGKQSLNEENDFKDLQEKAKKIIRE